MANEFERWYSLKEIMDRLGVSCDTVLAWINKKNMPTSKMGKLWKFKISGVDELVKAANVAE